MAEDKPRAAEEIFREASNLPPDKRDQFLNERCGEDTVLKSQVETRLRERPQADPGSDAATRFYDTPTTDKLPDRIGPFKIIGKLGAGGMGVVYEAEQSSPKRRVAVKVIRGGQLVDDVGIRMFQREADALARLRHANIGAIYESGRTEAGEHYFAMELVRGGTLSDFLRDSTPAEGLSPADVRTRLELLRTLANAVHYAHQRGVIHRDLKPSNILVDDEASESDSTAGTALDVKILDFGLARITDVDVQRSAVSEVGAVKGTLSYMSPEQARGDPSEIDVRTDVYSLGVMLYEMLSGQLPKEIPSGSILEALRVIMEDPPRPLQQTFRGPKRLSPDVATICHKALELSADDRYGSVAALADDIDRYLNDQPIQARPPSTIYQIKKLVVRNKLLTVFAATVALFVAAFAVTMTIQAGRIANERDRANLEASTATEVSEFLTGLFTGSDPREARGEDVSAREILGRGVDEIANLDEQPELQARLQYTMGVVHHRLGLLSESERLLQHAFDTRVNLLGPDDPATLDAREYLGISLYTTGRFAEAEPLLRQTVEGRTIVNGPQDPRTIESVSNLAALLRAMSREVEAEQLYAVALERGRRVLGDDHSTTLEALRGAAALHANKGRIEEAEEMYLELLERLQNQQGEDHPRTLDAMNALGGLYRYQRRFQEAEPLLVQSLEGRRRVLGDDHNETLESMANLGKFFAALGRFDEAEPLFHEVLEARLQTFGRENSATLAAMQDLATLAEAMGQTAQADSLFAETLHIRRKVLGNDHAQTVASLNNLANRFAMQGQLARAEPLYVEALETNRRLSGDDDPLTLDIVGNLGILYAMLGQTEKAEKYFTESLEIRTRVLGPNHPDTALSHYNLACLLADMGDRERAMESARNAVAAGYSDFESLATDEYLENLHSPEFDELVELARGNAEEERVGVR